jgi:hypothetical protein
MRPIPPDRRKYIDTPTDENVSSDVRQAVDATKRLLDGGDARSAAFATAAADAAMRAAYDRSQAFWKMKPGTWAGPQADAIKRDLVAANAAQAEAARAAKQYGAAKYASTQAAGRSGGNPAATKAAQDNVQKTAYDPKKWAEFTNRGKTTTEGRTAQQVAQASRDYTAAQGARRQAAFRQSARIEAQRYRALANNINNYAASGGRGSRASMNTSRRRKVYGFNFFKGLV